MHVHRDTSTSVGAAAPLPSAAPDRRRRFRASGKRAVRRPARLKPSLPAPLRAHGTDRSQRAAQRGTRLLEEFTPLVHAIAGRLLRRLPSNVLRDDLVAAGMSGLWDAIRRCPGNPGGGFEWYVRVRVRGAMLDELRAQDWLPRRARALDASTAGTARHVPAPSVVRLDDVSEWEQNRCLVEAAGAEIALSRKLSQEALDQALEKLPGRERHILRAHYFRGARFKDLGAELGVSEPRVSQLHSRALVKLRALLESAA